MRDLKVLQKSLNQTQRIRLQNALQQLQEIYSRAPSSPAATAAVSVSDSIHVNLEDGVLKGHGTTNRNDDVVATVCGFVERVNKLVYVRDFRARYKPEVGDIIVGRVIEVVSKRWRLEINFSQDAVLMLSSMNLPDGMQRRQTATDELNMRSIFEENDVICAEVRGFNNHDGTLQLQARSQKYGKLERGQMLTVPSYLVKRRKQHFHNLEQYGVDMILGCNGFIWVGEHVEHDVSIPVETVKSSIKNMSIEEHSPNNFTPLETRQSICRIANAIRVLSTLGCALSVEAILNTVEWSISSNVEIKDMLLSEFCVQAAEIEVQRRVTLTKRIKPCPNNQNLNPRNCECAYAYTGTMELRAPSFSSFTDAERFRSLERSLWEKLDLLNNSVYVEFQNDDPDRSTYNVIKIQLFPSMKISFDRSEISEIGFKLSNQTYKPPPGFGPFTFHGDPYLYFDGVSEKTSNNNIGIIAGIACGCATLVIVIVASIILVVRKKKREGRMNDRSHNFEGWGEEKTKDSGPAPQLKGAKLFSFDDLRKYTNDFSVINEIGTGGYGKVYKGLLPNGILVAIKRAVSGSMQGGIEFKNEIELLSRVHHKNLVSLIGFCFDKNEQILVYEYIPNGTLRESLLGKTGIVLDWKRRLKVALGSARGLAYLHDNADPSIIHRDVKSSNILLNGNLSAKVADFGLSKLMPDVELGHVSTQVKGTIGYVDPEYYMTQHLTEKSDVYSFGVVMMELITGKPPIERGQYIVRQVRQMLNKDDETRGLKYIIDPLIQNTPHLFGLGNFVDLALRCVEEASDNRPNMCEVVRKPSRSLG